MSKNSQYLTINQLAKICSTSRAALLRMEEDQILAPVYVNPENGYRYYDETSVLRVSRNLSLQEFGITHKELKNYYTDTHNYHDLLNKLEHKMAIMEYHISNLRMQLAQEKQLQVSYSSFPELYCYTHTMINVTDLSSVRPNIWNIFNDAISEGYSINRQMHPFVIVDYQSIESNNYQNVGYDYIICIPVLPSEDCSKLEHFDMTDIISTVIYGGSSNIQDAFIKLSAEKEKQNLLSTGPARVIAVVNSYPGEEIPLEHWVTKICIPVSNKN